MKKNLPSLLAWTLLFYYVFGPLRLAAERGEAQELFRFLAGRDDFLLVITSFISFSMYTLLAYLSVYHTYPKRRYPLTVLLVLAVIPTAVAFRYLLQEVIMKAVWGFGNYTDGYPLTAYFFDNLYYGFIFTGLGVILFFVRFSRYQEQQRLDYEIENQKTQLSLLRLQLNPHFLFNALNSIYSLVNEKNDLSLHAIEKLSNLLRYGLYERSETVALSKEWAFIEDYMELERLRLPYEPAILLDVPTRLPDIRVPPFSLITFVENAFKHGKIDDVDNPVRVKIATTPTDFIFTIKNPIAPKVKDHQGGIGLENLKKRLAIHYRKNHDLAIEKNDTSFSVKLKIPLALC